MSTEPTPYASLESALIDNNPEAAIIFIQNKSSPIVLNKEEFFALYNMITESSPEFTPQCIVIFELLIKKGFNINTSFTVEKNDVDEENSGRTLLMAATENGNTDLVKFLLDHRANVKIIDTAYYENVLFRLNDNTATRELVELLISAGADSNHKNDSGESLFLNLIKTARKTVKLVNQTKQKFSSSTDVTSERKPKRKAEDNESDNSQNKKHKLDSKDTSSSSSDSSDIYPITALLEKFTLRNNTKNTSPSSSNNEPKPEQEHELHASTSSTSTYRPPTP